MNRNLLLVVLFGVVIAGGASFVLYHLLMNMPANHAAPGANAVHVIVATRNLEPGETVKPSDFKLVNWQGPAPEGVPSRETDVIGRGVTEKIYQGEPIALARLAPPGSGGGLASMIPPGMRAVALHVNDVVGVAGFAVAGTHVDVLSSGSPAGPGGTSSEVVTRTLLQDITVLSAGQDYKQSDDGKPITVQVVNLLVTPQQAELLSLAGNQTTIQLVLRNPTDKQIAETRGTELSSIFASRPAKATVRPVTVAAAPAPAAAPPAPPKPSTFAMEVIEGNRRTVQTTGVAR